MSTRDSPQEQLEWIKYRKTEHLDKLGLLQYYTIKAPNYFSNNFVKPRSILINFGVHIL